MVAANRRHIKFIRILGGIIMAKLNFGRVKAIKDSVVDNIVEDVDNVDLSTIEENSEVVSEEHTEEELALLELQKITPVFIENKFIFDTKKKLVDKAKEQIKELFSKAKISDFIVGRKIIKVTTVESTSFDTLSLIRHLKKLKIKGLIKNNPYIDMDMLEDLLYKKEIDASTLVQFEVHSKSTRLSVSNIKN
jgi:hypothetical protein